MDSPNEEFDEERFWNEVNLLDTLLKPNDNEEENLPIYHMSNIIHHQKEEEINHNDLQNLMSVPRFLSQPPPPQPEGPLKEMNKIIWALQGEVTGLRYYVDQLQKEIGSLRAQIADK